MQAILILCAILLGIIIYPAYQLTFLIRYQLMVMLFFAFLNVVFRKETVHLNHFKILFFNLFFPLLFYALCYPFHPTIALTGFVIGIAPTAAAAPVIADLLRSDKVDFVTTSVLITSPIIAIILPFILPHVLPVQDTIRISSILVPIGQVIFIPLILAQLVKSLWPTIARKLNRYRRLTFYLFLINIFIASASASNFIRHDDQTSWSLLFLLAVCVGGLCLFLFLFGEWLGRKELAVETGLGLGRKNTMFAIWLSLTYLNPVVALGPMFYIVFQNAYSSYQMYAMKKPKS